MNTSVTRRTDPCPSATAAPATPVGTFTDVAVGRLDGRMRDWPWAQPFVDPASRRLVGIGGYVGPPVGTSVGIRYSAAPGPETERHATEAIGQLVEGAAVAGVEWVGTWTLPDQDLAIRVLERLGFGLVVDWNDPGQGPLWLWERRA